MPALFMCTLLSRTSRQGTTEMLPRLHYCMTFIMFVQHPVYVPLCFGQAEEALLAIALASHCCRELARRRGIPTQEFCVKSDMACGSTIGPILSSGLGCRTVDVGGPQLSMHSIREMCGTKVRVPPLP